VPPGGPDALMEGLYVSRHDLSTVSSRQEEGQEGWKEARVELVVAESEMIRRGWIFPQPRR